MIDWIKTAQGVAAIIAAVFATMVAWSNLGLPRLVFSPELAPIRVGPSSTPRTAATHSTTTAGLLLVPVGPDNRLKYAIAGTLGTGSWASIVVTYDKDAGPNN